MSTFRVTNDTMSITVECDANGKITFAPAGVGQFLGKNIANLERWLKTQGGFQKEIIPEKKEIKQLAYTMEPGQGSLFANEKKTQENQPNSTGKAICPCCQNTLLLSGWTKTTQAGKKWVSLALKPADENAQSAPTPPPETHSDIPF